MTRKPLTDTGPLDLMNVVEMIPALVVCVSPDGSFEYVNRAWQEYTGCSLQQLAQFGWQNTVNPDDLGELVDEEGVVFSARKQLVETEARVRRVDGQYRWFVAKKTVAILRTGAGSPSLHTLVAFEDIDERKKVEVERERLRRELAHLAHLDRVNRIGELTASLGHELKQPIGAAVTNAEACLRFLDREQPDVAEAREAVLEAIRDARRAADVIDRVRSLYRMGSSHQEPVDVNEVIQQMADMLRDGANQQGVTISTDLAQGSPRVMADRVQLQQVLMNLMLNAIEAMRDTGGELVIRSQLTGDSQLLVSVTDDGIGLPTGDVEEIFKGFVTTKSDGTGLGLTISRSIVESHGGRIWANANSGRGATFNFTLPKVNAAHA
jgi:PAS domain S-box-containing protein